MYPRLRPDQRKRLEEDERKRAEEAAERLALSQIPPMDRVRAHHADLLTLEPKDLRQRVNLEPLRLMLEADRRKLEEMKKQMPPKSDERNRKVHKLAIEKLENNHKDDTARMSNEEGPAKRWQDLLDWFDSPPPDEA